MNRRQFLGLSPALVVPLILSGCGNKTHLTGTVRSLSHSGGGTYLRNHRLRRHPDYFWVTVLTPQNSYKTCRISHGQWVNLHRGDRVTNMPCY